MSAHRPSLPATAVPPTAHEPDGSCDAMVATIEREWQALGLSHPQAREHAALGLCFKHVWVAVREEAVRQRVTALLNQPVDPIEPVRPI